MSGESSASDNGQLSTFRDGQAKAVTLTLGELPRVPTEANVEEPVATAEKPILGLTVAACK